MFGFMIFVISSTITLGMAFAVSKIHRLKKVKQQARAIGAKEITSIKYEGVQEKQPVHGYKIEGYKVTFTDVEGKQRTENIEMGEVH